MLNIHVTFTSPPENFYFSFTSHFSAEQFIRCITELYHLLILNREQHVQRWKTIFKIQPKTDEHEKTEFESEIDD